MPVEVSESRHVVLKGLRILKFHLKFQREQESNAYLKWTGAFDEAGDRLSTGLLQRSGSLRRRPARFGSLRLVGDRRCQFARGFWSF